MVSLTIQQVQIERESSVMLDLHGNRCTGNYLARGPAGEVLLSMSAAQFECKYSLVTAAAMGFSPIAAKL